MSDVRLARFPHYVVPAEDLGRFTLDHALNTTGNQGLEYRIAQYTIVTKNGNVTTVEYKTA